MIKYSKRFLQRGEVWFDEKPVDKVDVLTFYQTAEPVTGAQCSDFYTLITDLSKPSEDLFQGFSKGTRYEIRRAEKSDEIAYEFWSESIPDQIFAEFCDCYNQFAKEKRLAPVDGAYLARLMAADLLDLSVVKDNTGNGLVWHAYYRKNDRVRLLHSCSLFRENADNVLRNLIGRANRLHHWRDIERFKQDGVLQYDLGGWYEGDSDAEKLRINQFKSEFGGVVVRNYNCIQTVTLKARILLKVSKWLKSFYSSIRRAIHSYREIQHNDQ